MGVFGFVCGVASAISSSIASAVGSIGAALSSFASAIAPALGNLIHALTPVAEALGKFANGFLQALGIIKPDEKIEEMGDRALQARETGGITIEKFERFDDYLNALRDYKLDPELSKKYSPAEKLVTGLGLGTIAVEDKFNAERGSLNGMWLLPIANPDYFTPERMQSLLTTGRLGGDIYAYLEKRLSGGEARSIEKGMEFGLDGKPMNDAELATFHSALDGAQSRWADLARQVEEKQTQGA